LKIEQLRMWLGTQRTVTPDENQRAFQFYAMQQIKRFQDDPKKMNLTRPQEPPDGQPIGMDWWEKADAACNWR